MKPQSIQISIPHPCTQGWDEMTPNGAGRDCTHCQKNVIDFTTWSDAALYNFFAKNNGDVCGRYLSTQQDRPINIPYQPHSRLYGMTVALGLTLMFTQTPFLLAQNRPPKVEQSTQVKRSNDSTMGNGEIKGLILDEKKEPLISAVVQVYQNNVLVGGNVTDYDGNYIIDHLEPGNYDILVLYFGYDSIEAKQIAVVRNEPSTINFNMQRNKNYPPVSGMIIVHYGRPVIDMDNPTKRTFTREEINNMPIR